MLIAYMRKQNLALTLLFLFTICFRLEAYSASVVHTVVDSTLEKLFVKSEFKQANGLIISKLKKSSSVMNDDQKLYYLSSLSLSFFRLNEFDSAKYYALRSLKLVPVSRDSMLISKAWKVMAYAYNRCGQLDSALIYTNKLLAYARRANDMLQLRSALSSLGSILMQNKRPQEALKYFMEVNQVNRILKDSNYFTTGWYNIGLAYYNLKKIDSSLLWLKNAARLADKQKQPDLLLLTYGSISDSYLFIGDHKKGKEFLIKANEIAYRIGDLLSVAMGYSNLAETALKDKDYATAIKYGIKADSLLVRNPFPALEIIVDSMISVAYKESGSPAEALRWFTSFMEKKEALVNERQTNLLNKMMIDFGVKEKNLIISEQQKEIRNKKIQLRLVISLLLLIVIFLSFVANYLYKTKLFRRNLYQKERYLDSQVALMTLRYGMMKGEENLPTRIDVGLMDDYPGNAHANIEAVEEEDLIASDEEINEELTADIPHHTLYLRFLDLLEDQKLYLNPDLHTQLIIRSLGTNKKYLYQAISLHSKDNFRGILNRYRVDEAKRIIEEKILSSSQIEMSEIFVQAGFNAAVSFYRSFKMYTGLTPKEYQNEAKQVFRKLKSLS